MSSFHAVVEGMRARTVQKKDQQKDCAANGQSQTSKEDEISGVISREAVSKTKWRTLLRRNNGTFDRETTFYNRIKVIRLLSK